MSYLRSDKHARRIPNHLRFDSNLTQVALRARAADADVGAALEYWFPGVQIVASGISTRPKRRVLDSGSKYDAVGASTHGAQRRVAKARFADLRTASDE